MKSHASARIAAAPAERRIYAAALTFWAVLPDKSGVPIL
jgi:hypothetical protein